MYMYIFKDILSRTSLKKWFIQNEIRGNFYYEIRLLKFSRFWSSGRFDE